MRCVCFLLILVVLSSCQEKRKQEREAVGRTVAPDSISTTEPDVKKLVINHCDSISFPEDISVDIAQKIAPITRGWFKYYGLKMTDFKYTGCNNFELNDRYSHPMDSLDANLKTDVKRNIYSYSPDKKKYIDIYFYTHYDERRKTIVFDGEVDQLVWLYDMENRMGYVVQSWGPSGACEDVAWIDNDRFVLLENTSDGLFIIDIFDIRKKVIASYTSELEGKEFYGGYYLYNAKKKGILEPIYD